MLLRRDLAGPLGAGLVLNVRDFGASGAGVVDDFAAITAAIGAAPSTGATVYLPAGTYALGNQLVLPSYVRLVGAGVRATRLVQNNEDVHGIYATDVTQVVVEDLTVIGQSSGTGSGVVFETTAGVNAYLTIRNVNVQTFGGNGVTVERGIVSTLDKVVSQGHGGHGFNIDDGTSVNLISCYGLSCEQAGYRINSMAYCALDGCATDHCGIGYLLVGSQGISLNGCGCELPENNSVDHPGTAFKIDGGFANGLYNCVNFDNAGIAVHVTGSSTHNTIVNFDENTPTVGATASIQVDAGSRATVIAPKVSTAVNYVGNVTRIGGDAVNDFVSAGSTSVVRGSTTTGSGSNTQPVFLARGVDTSNRAYGAQLTADAAIRWIALADGKMEWGDGTNARDTNWYRRSAGVVGSDHTIHAGVNLRVNTTSVGGGTGVFGMANAGVVPASNPTGGGVLYIEGGALKYRGSGGTVTVIAPA